jgi:hypothetical protein
MRNNAYLTTGVVSSERRKKMDEVLGKMREARALLLEERDSGGNSRELSIVLTQLDTAILWRQQDLQMKEAGIKNTHLPPRFA